MYLNKELLDYSRQYLSAYAGACFNDNTAKKCGEPVSTTLFGVRDSHGFPWGRTERYLYIVDDKSEKRACYRVPITQKSLISFELLKHAFMTGEKQK